MQSCLMDSIGVPLPETEVPVMLLSCFPSQRVDPVYVSHWGLVNLSRLGSGQTARPGLAGNLLMHFRPQERESLMHRSPEWASGVVSVGAQTPYFRFSSSIAAPLNIALILPK